MMCNVLVTAMQFWIVVMKMKACFLVGGTVASGLTAPGLLLVWHSGDVSVVQ